MASLDRFKLYTASSERTSNRLGEVVMLGMVEVEVEVEGAKKKKKKTKHR